MRASECTWIVTVEKDSETGWNEVIVDTTCGAYIDNNVLEMAEADFTNCPYCGGDLTIKTSAQAKREAYEEWADSEVDRRRDEEILGY